METGEERGRWIACRRRARARSSRSARVSAERRDSSARGTTTQCPRPSPVGSSLCPLDAGLAPSLFVRLPSWPRSVGGGPLKSSLRAEANLPPSAEGASCSEGSLGGARHADTGTHPRGDQHARGDPRLATEQLTCLARPNAPARREKRIAPDTPSRTHQARPRGRKEADKGRQQIEVCMLLIISLFSLCSWCSSCLYRLRSSSTGLSPLAEGVLVVDFKETYRPLVRWWANLVRVSELPVIVVRVE